MKWKVNYVTINIKSIKNRNLELKIEIVNECINIVDILLDIWGQYLIHREFFGDMNAIKTNELLEALILSVYTPTR